MAIHLLGRCFRLERRRYFFRVRHNRGEINGNQIEVNLVVNLNEDSFFRVESFSFLSSHFSREWDQRSFLQICVHLCRIFLERDECGAKSIRNFEQIYLDRYLAPARGTTSIRQCYSRVSSKKFILSSLSLSFSLLLFIFRIISRLSFRPEVQSIKFRFIKVWKTSFCLVLLLVLLCINISCSCVVALLISYRILFSLAALTR